MMNYQFDALVKQLANGFDRVSNALKDIATLASTKTQDHMDITGMREQIFENAELLYVLDSNRLWSTADRRDFSLITFGESGMLSAMVLHAPISKGHPEAEKKVFMRSPPSNTVQGALKNMLDLTMLRLTRIPQVE